MHVCHCNTGYEGDGAKCAEIDACAAEPCDKHATCDKTGPGTFACDCAPGYEGNGETCAEVNACLSDPCHTHATCSKTGAGTFHCECADGYTGDGLTCLYDTTERVARELDHDDKLQAIAERIDDLTSDEEETHDTVQDQQLGDVTTRVKDLSDTTAELLAASKETASTLDQIAATPNVPEDANSITKATSNTETDRIRLDDGSVSVHTETHTDAKVKDLSKN
jgi:hypothetical protein